MIIKILAVLAIITLALTAAFMGINVSYNYIPLNTYFYPASTPLNNITEGDQFSFPVLFINKSPFSVSCTYSVNSPAFIDAHFHAGTAENATNRWSPGSYLTLNANSTYSLTLSITVGYFNATQAGSFKVNPACTRLR